MRNRARVVAGLLLVTVVLAGCGRGPSEERVMARELLGTLEAATPGLVLSDVTSFGLAFDQDTGRGEIVAECFRMR